MRKKKSLNIKNAFFISVIIFKNNDSTTITFTFTLIKTRVTSSPVTIRIR